MMHMADLNIRNVDEKLLRSIKVRAAEGGLTLRGWCIGVLSLACAYKNGDRGVGAEWEQNKARTQQNTAVAVQRPPLDKERSPELPSGEVGKAQERPKRPRVRKVSKEPEGRVVGSEKAPYEYHEIADAIEDIEDFNIEMKTAPEVEMCTYTEYNGEVGETFRCGLPKHSGKVKHRMGEKV